MLARFLEQRIVGIEVKFAASITASDAKPLKSLAAELGSRFVRGVVLYAGSETVPFERNIHGLPVSAL